MAKKNQQVQDENLENVQEALSASGKWIEQNQNMLTWCLTGILLVVCAIILLNNYVWKPKAAEAQNETGKAVVYFQQNNWEQALNGDDNDCIGFQAIADEYSHYQAGKLAALYAGICNYKLGDYEEAAKNLKKFSADDLNIDPAAKLLLGDAYVQLDELAKAVAAYEQVADTKNEVIAPIALKKLGFVKMEQGDNKAAKKAFEQIKDNYPMSAEAQDIDKYISLLD
ncbi:MAG: tetratricopeptide repeat protein [Paludibacteraceae bacterium]|nr:tetratricopeptide repeat protein [Paludibacteraceae bacterium]